MLIRLLCLALLATGCKKTGCLPPEQPNTDTILYTDFNNRTVGFNQSYRADVDGDGAYDVKFYTMHVGDGVLMREYKQFYIGSNINVFNPVNSVEETPMLSTGDRIALDAFPGYGWGDVTSVIVASKVYPQEGNPYWIGNFKDAEHRYAPFYIHKPSGDYYGWVELSFSTVTEQFTLHRAGVSKELGKAVKAGW